MKLNSLVLGIAALSSNPAKTYDQNTMCNVVFASYMNGCIDTYKDRNWSDAQIAIIVANCIKAATVFIKGIDDCKKAEIK